MNLDERNAVFSPKDPEEVVTLAFDFTVFYDSGFTDAEVTVTHNSGTTDASASSMAVNLPSISGGVVYQDIQDGVDNADYLVTCKVTHGANKFIISGILPVRVAKGYFSQSEIQ